MTNLLNLINFGELSRVLAGSRSVITRERIGKKHRRAVAQLEAKLREWHEALPELDKQTNLKNNDNGK